MMRSTIGLAGFLVATTFVPIVVPSAHALFTTESCSSQPSQCVGSEYDGRLFLCSACKGTGNLGWHSYCRCTMQGTTCNLDCVVASGAWDPRGLACRNQIAKSFTRAVLSGEKVVASCHKGRDAAKVGASVDCNDPSPTQADQKGRFQRAQEKLVASITQSCTDAAADDSILAEFISCPEPCGTSTGISNPLVSHDELAQCLACVAGDVVQRRNTGLLGSPAIPLSYDERRCRRAISKSFGKHLKTLLRERARCQKTADATNETDTEACATADPSSHIQEAARDAALELERSCAGVSLSVLDTCAQTNLADLSTCATALSELSGTEAFRAGYGSDATICPTGIDSMVLDGLGVPETSRSSFDLGWTGLSHDIDLPGGYTLGAQLTCPPAPPCGSCTVDGIASHAPDSASFNRCANDLTRICDTPFTSDAETCGGNQCLHLLAPPIPISAGGSPVCSINALYSDLTGTLDPATGASVLNVAMFSVAHVGESVSHPCPVCVGDPIARDGEQGGLCQGGSNADGPCDVDGFDPTFARESIGEGLAFDCPPLAANNVSGSGLALAYALTTGHSELGAAIACDSGRNCACGVCSLDPKQACHSDADCEYFNAGSCVLSGTGTAKPNGCSDVSNCQIIGAGKAECMGGEADELRFCEGIRQLDGGGVIPCASDDDCSEAVCAGGCGPCSVTQKRPCFLDPIVAEGKADRINPLLVSTFCVPPTSSAAINSTAGLPGPARIATELVNQMIY